ncbi:MAG TPA: fatty acid hydroxylase family protein [Casimicrobiaceae bacterium]|nr:fatty acid hydroxylase family protein [Casimicrobiaceae bacterium]
MMTERQRRFREKYVSEISPWYHGFVHIGVMYAAGISAILWCVSRMQNPTWEWLLIIPVAIAGNFMEWAMHKFVMHRLRDVYAVRAIYDRHTRQHHQYFTDNDPTISTVKEFRIVFFPWRVLIVLAVFGSVLGWIAAQLINPNAGYVVFVTMIGHYMVYETFHFCCHVPDNAFVRNMPFINTIRRHHAAHHNMGIMMHVNMNLTFPIADWAMGTSDLRRGLLGHLFNGYDERYIKQELKPVIARFRTSETQNARCTLDGPRLEDEEVRTIERAVSHA